MVKAGSHPWTLSSVTLYPVTHTVRQADESCDAQLGDALMSALILVATGLYTWVPVLGQQRVSDPSP